MCLEDWVIMFPMENIPEPTFGHIEELLFYTDLYSKKDSMIPYHLY